MIKRQNDTVEVISPYIVPSLFLIIAEGYSEGNLSSTYSQICFTTCNSVLIHSTVQSLGKHWWLVKNLVLFLAALIVPAKYILFTLSYFLHYPPVFVLFRLTVLWHHLR